MLGVAVETIDYEAQEGLSSERDRDLFRLARAFGCEPVDITPPWEDGAGDASRMYLIDFSTAAPDERSALELDGSREPVEEAAEERAKRLDEGLAAVAEYEAEFGPFTPEEKAWARAVLDRAGIGMDS